MSPGLMALVVTISFLVVLALGLPVAFSLLGLSIMFMLLFLNPNVLFAAYAGAFSVMTKDIYIAIPMFVFMAAVLQFSGVAERLYAMMYKWFGGIRGGLAIGSVAICTLIAAMTGIGATGVVTMGLLAYPEMMKRGYHKSIPLGCIPAGGALGPIIPPSVIMIIVGGFAELSVGKMFMGGVFPGLLMAFLFMGYIAIKAFRNPQMAPALPVDERASWKEKLISLKGVTAPLILIVLVLGSIYSGAATPSEAGGIGAFGAMVCAVIYRTLKWNTLVQGAITTLKITCMVMWLLIGGTAFSSLMTLTRLTYVISEALSGAQVSPMVILGIMMLIALILGMFMDASAISMITLPIFIPVAFSLGFDLLWFALLFTINVVIGYLTPPFGANLFYMKGITPPDVRMADIYRASTPYVIIMLLVLIIGIVWPPLLVWLPSLMK